MLEKGGDHFTPNFEYLLQAIRILSESSQLEFIRLVLVSQEEKPKFIEISGNLEARQEIEQAVSQGLIPLGLLGWEMTRTDLKAKRLMFPWHEDGRLKDLFESICEDAIDRVGAQIKNN